MVTSNIPSKSGNIQIIIEKTGSSGSVHVGGGGGGGGGVGGGGSV